MKSGYYYRVNESTLVVLDLVSYHANAVDYSGMMITRINVPRPFRGQGYGSKVLDLCIADADAEKVTLWLEIAPTGGLEWEALEAWYRRRGFQGPSTGVLRRKPR